MSSGCAETLRRVYHSPTGYASQLELQHRNGCYLPRFLSVFGV